MLTMSLDLIQTLPYDSISSLVRKTAYGLVTTCILGTAVYAGYRVAALDKYAIKRHRHPELNDQVIQHYIKVHVRSLSFSRLKKSSIR